MARSKYFVKLLRECPYCFGTGKEIEGAVFDENGNLEYYEEELGICERCNGKGYVGEEVVSLERLAELLREIENEN